MTPSERALADQNGKKQEDEELLATIRTTVDQLNLLVDRLEKFVADPTDESSTE